MRHSLKGQEGRRRESQSRAPPTLTGVRPLPVVSHEHVASIERHVCPPTGVKKMTEAKMGPPLFPSSSTTLCQGTGDPVSGHKGTQGWSRQHLVERWPTPVSLRGVTRKGRLWGTPSGPAPWEQGSGRHLTGNISFDLHRKLIDEKTEDPPKESESP